MGFNGDLMADTRPGKQPHNELERSTILIGKTHCFSTGPCSSSQSVSHYQAGYLEKSGDEPQALEALRPQEIQESLGFGEAESGRVRQSPWRVAAQQK